MNRRVFLKSGAMAMLSLGFAPSFLGRAAAAVGSHRKLLIAIFQRGAVDGLNMIVPHGEADYYRLRPTIAIPRPSGDLRCVRAATVSIENAMSRQKDFLFCSKKGNFCSRRRAVHLTLFPQKHRDRPKVTFVVPMGTEWWTGIDRETHR